jgi:hypothetical protein
MTEVEALWKTYIASANITETMYVDDVKVLVAHLVAAVKGRGAGKHNRLRVRDWITAKKKNVAEMTQSEVEEYIAQSAIDSSRRAALPGGRRAAR